MVVHNEASEADLEVIPGLFFTTDRSTIERLVGSAGSVAKFFVGYAGWGPGQLEGELESGSWLTFPADTRQVFRSETGQWSRLTACVTLGKWIDPRLIPDDPTVN